jgi:mannose/fructose/N-acetylgalactosamine-specific phosphotransferase system component IID
MEAMPEPGRMQAKGFKTLVRGLVVGLVIVVGLVAHNIDMPKGRSTSKNWNFVLTHPTIFLHVIFACLVLLGATVLLVRSVHSRVQSWIVISAIGLAFVIFAFARGAQYVSTLNNNQLDNMGIGWFGAIATYGVGWYLNRKATSQPMPSESPPERP